MKIRNGFVSNSSSSSFIVFGKTFVKEHIPSNAFRLGAKDTMELVLPNKNYNYEFGWEDVAYDSVMDKLNFVAIQTNYIINRNIDLYEKWVKRIEHAVRKDFKETHPEMKVKVIFNFGNNTGWNSAYIDHQSSAEEGANIEMFDSDEKMYNFLFNRESYIQGGNDNDYGYDE